MPDLLSPAEAAVMLGVSDRTLRDRAKAAGVAVIRQNGRCFYDRQMLCLLGGSAIPASAEPLGEALPQSPRLRKSMDDAVVRERLKGAQMAAKLSSLRRRDGDRERERLEQERDRLCGQVEFLQAQLGQARDAERELRLLLAQSVTRACAEAEQRALPRWRRWWVR